MLLLLVGASSGALLPKAGAWMEGIKHFFGVLLLATAWWMVNSVVPAWLAVLGWAALALWSAVMLHAFEPLAPKAGQAGIVRKRSEEHTSELQSLMRISYAFFCLNKKTKDRLSK